LAAEHGVGSDLRRVANQDEVIELGAAADARFADGGAVHAGIGLHFDVIFEHRGAGLRHFVPGAVFLFGEAEAVAADDGAILQDDAMAEAAVFADDGMRVSEEAVADFCAAVNRDETVQDGVAANLHVFVDVAIRADVGAFADVRGLGDDGGGVDAGCVAGGLIEEFNGVSESQIGICGAKRGEGRGVRGALDGDTLFDEHGRGARGFQKREVTAVGQESELAGFGVVHAGDTVDFDVWRAFQAASEFLRDFREFHGHGS